ncbi:MAG: GGDEF domain-containing protein [Salinibacter sp.]|uniref:GGDEF domain-containing protein n=1 Tax=Salinibacter sp. TaxID=2065818 RepID=UPI0035D41D76
MFRYLLALLTVVVAGLAILFDRLWLRVGAIGLLAGGLGLLGWQFWNAYQDDAVSRPVSESSSSEDSLEDLGIGDVRPRDEAASESSLGAARTDESGEQAKGASSTSGASEGSRSTEEELASTQAAAAPSNGGEAGTTDSADRSVATNGAPVLSPFIRSLRAALDAQTACLLVQEEIALTYRIEALASTHAQTRREGTFDTQAPLLTATMSRQSVSVRPLTEDEVAIEDLGYYERPPDVDHFAVAPVPRDGPSTTFLLADAPSTSDLGQSQARTLLERYAEMASLLLKTQAPSEGREQRAGDQDRGQTVRSSEGPSDTDEESSVAPRPRRDIIAEEMDAADTASKPLALVLVHLNRAESIARQGEEAVATAERLLQGRLEQFAPDQRVERFGELTYGIFYRGSAEVVESWVTDLEAGMAKEEGRLEGGVSVGAAVRRPRHDDPEALRADATEALREAYKTGTCTVVA